MTTFVKVTNINDGIEIYLNIKYIISIKPYRHSNSVIEYMFIYSGFGTRQLIVEEDIEEIFDKLKTYANVHIV